MLVTQMTRQVASKGEGHGAEVAVEATTFPFVRSCNRTVVDKDSVECYMAS